MGLIKGIHHIEMITDRFGDVCEYFVKCLGYQLFATVKDGVTHRVALKNGNSIFVVRNADCYPPRTNPFVHANYYEGEIIDSVYNIALEVANVQECVKSVLAAGGHIVYKPTIYTDYNGKVEMATVQSCVGNVIHTLVDSCSYKGLFLPGYTSPVPIIHDKNRLELIQSLDASGFQAINRLCHFSSHKYEQHITHADHVTFAIIKGSSDYVLRWYSNAFGMKRCQVNNEESVEDGFVVQYETNGLRLKAFDYWRCAETTLENSDATFKFVLAEPLSDSVPNQITTFLKYHGGPGIQHVGLHVKNIVDATREFRMRGVNFLSPPPIYYQESEKIKEISSLCLNPYALQEHGILLDVEECAPCGYHECKKPGYLLQVFTRPLFKRDTFFLELIERRGAKGFGAGNIKALWRAVDMYMKKGDK